MKSNEIMALIITIIGLISFATLFTYLYRSFAKNAITDIKTGKRDIELINAIVEEEENKKKRKIINITKSVFFYLALVIIIPVFIMSMVNKFNGNINSFGDKSFITIASGSMSSKNEDNIYVNDSDLATKYEMDNQFNKFDIVIVEKVKSVDDIKPFDVIAFRIADGTTVVHRVTNILNIDGKVTYVTQGDALPREDGLRPSYEDVVGVYTSKRIRGLGAIILFCQSYAGIITILSLIYCLTMLEHVNDKINKEEEGRVKELKEVLSYTSNGKPIKTMFYEEIQYNGFAYRFNDNGFVDKRELDPSELISEETSETPCEDTKEEPSEVTNENDETVEREKKDD